MEDIKYIVGNNLRSIRKDRNLSLQELSNLTNVSKSMLGEIERGVTNPTITVLWKIANGLKLPFTSLIKEEKPVISVVYNKNIKPTIQGDNFKISSIFDFDKEKNFEIYYEEIKPGGHINSEGHYNNTEEYLLIVNGTLSLDINGENYNLTKGDTINYIADKPHSYYNNSAETTEFYLIIYYNN